MPPRALALYVSVAVVRLVQLVASPTVVPGTQQLLLDVAALLSIAAASRFGRVLGTGFGSTAFVFVGLGLPIAGLGAVTDATMGPAASELAGMLALAGVGVGFVLAAPGRDTAFEKGLVSAVGLTALALAAKLLVEAFGPADGVAIGAPYGVACALALSLRPYATARTNAP